MKQTTEPDQLIRIGQAATMLGVSVGTLRTWTEQGRIPCVRIGPTGQRRFRLGDVQRLMSGR
jgi:transcriptional repressor of dcmA and dcmR